eukprot:6163542-Pleurochrysis_carterae.AAC.1
MANAQAAPPPRTGVRHLSGVLLPAAAASLSAHSGEWRTATSISGNSQNFRHSAKATYSSLRRWGEWRRDGPTYTS